MSHQWQRIHFYKMTGAGNDFIVIDNRQALWIRTIAGISCARRAATSFRGADGVILSRTTLKPISNGAFSTRMPAKRKCAATEHAAPPGSPT